MILFSGHKSFTHRGEDYQFNGEIEMIGNESSYTGKLERIVYGEDDFTLIEDDNFSADELIDLMEIELPFLYFLENDN